jgi:hypothetical protein
MAIADHSANKLSKSDDIQELKCPLVRHSNPRWLRTTSAECLLSNDTVGLLYSDGDRQ